MIVFNISALGQAIVIFLLVFLCEWMGIRHLLPFAQSVNDWLFMCFLYWIVAITYRAGVKGKVFWVPTWIWGLGFLWLVGRLNGFYDAEPGFWLATFKVFTFVFPLFLGLVMVRRTDLKFYAQFAYARQSLANLNKTDAAYDMDKAAFWAGISHTFVWPSASFRFAYPLYKRVNTLVVAPEELAEHYKEVAHCIAPRVTRPENRMAMEQMEQRLAQSARFGEINLDAIRKIAQVIDSENQIWNRK